MEFLIAQPGDKLQGRITIARALKHKEVIVCYTKHDKRNKRREDVKIAVLVSTTNQAKALKKSYDYIVAPCKREFFESRFVDFILEPEDQKRSDFIHHRNSGLHQVLLKLCQATTKRPAKSIITSSSLLNTKQAVTILGRMMQNARWCKKYEVAYHMTSGARKMMEQRDKACLDALKRVLI